MYLFFQFTAGVTRWLSPFGSLDSTDRLGVNPVWLAGKVLLSARLLSLSDTSRPGTSKSTAFWFDCSLHSSSPSHHGGFTLPYSHHASSYVPFCKEPTWLWSVWSALYYSCVHSEIRVQLGRCWFVDIGELLSTSFSNCDAQDQSPFWSFFFIEKFTTRMLKSCLLSGGPLHNPNLHSPWRSASHL